MTQSSQLWKTHMNELALKLVQCRTYDDGIGVLLHHIVDSSKAAFAFWRWVDRDLGKAYAYALPEDKVPLIEDLPVHGKGVVLLPGMPMSLRYTSASACALIPISLDDTLSAVIGVLFTESESLDDDLIDLLETYEGMGQILLRHMQQIDYYEHLIQNHNQFVRVVSHDLRSPLTSMLGFASMLESAQVGALDEKQTYYLHKVLSGINHITQLVENIQDAGRFDPETGFYELERNVTDMIELIDHTVANFLPSAEQHNIELQADVAEDLPIIYVDLGMLERALNNLVDNAMKYVPEGGSVTVGASVQDQQIVVWVGDNGYGISDEHQAKLFDRHFRVRRQEHHRVKGSGLGLFIVRSVAIRHGGDAWVESLEGEGSAFYFSIPLKGENLINREAVASVDAE